MMQTGEIRKGFGLSECLISIARVFTYVSWYFQLIIITNTFMSKYRKFRH